MTSADSMIMDTLSHFSGCDRSSLFRSNTVWNTMRVDKEFCKSTDDGFVRSIACRKGKGLTRTVRTEHCSFRGGKWSYQAADWSPQEMELSIGLCSWQIWHSAAPIARSALASGSPCCHKPHLCYHGLFVHGPSVQ